MITTYQLARKNFYKASSKFVKLKTDKIANAVLTLKDTVNGINKTYHKTSQYDRFY